jgi:hypothetical protein
LSFCQAKTTLCLSHEVLDVLLNEHLVPCRSIPDEMPTGLSAIDACGQSLHQRSHTYVRGAQIANPAEDTVNEIPVEMGRADLRCPHTAHRRLG